MTQATPLRAIHFDLWETVINDGPERSLPRQAWRAAEVKRALDVHGVDLALEPITTALNASMRALTQLHDTGVDLDSIGRARLFQGQLESEAQTRVPEVALHHLNTQPPSLPEQFSRYQRLMDKLIEKDRDARFRNADEVIGFLSRKYYQDGSFALPA